jgi:glycosyltransferase involved in cell wall biosynthesis
MHNSQSERRRPRIAVVASLTSSLLNFRIELLREFVRAGYDVFALAPDDDAEMILRLKEFGVEFRRIPMARASISPWQDAVTLMALVRAFRSIRPDVVLSYTMKPIIYGGVASRLAGVRRRFALVTGLGYVFIERTRTWRSIALRRLSVGLYKTALKGAERVFVYNEADAAELRDHSIVPAQSLMRVAGSGVNTDVFEPRDPPDGPPVFLLIARLLWDKGILEYVNAARILRQRHPHVRCQLLGPFDPNPAAISREQIAAWQREGSIEYLGHTKDVRPCLAGCSVFVLPSYREGISRTILEAMATGRAVITSDAPGCAEAIEDRVTGFVVPARDAPALAAAMEKFVSDPAQIREMGFAARRRVEELFDVRAVNRTLLREMKLTLHEGVPAASSTLKPARAA